MTRGSPKAANAGQVTAAILVVVALVFAALKLGAIGTYGNAMDGAIVVVELASTTIVTAIALLVALVVANRRPS
jgi:purine-cytosine permease-like protein